MNFHVVSLFPEMILSGLKEGVVASAINKKIISIECVNPRKFASDVHHTVDDRPYGGGDGMIMLSEPIEKSIAHFLELEPAAEIIYLSARGEVFDDRIAKELAKKPNLILICGRYGGVDQRVLLKNNVREISIGDYILSGGEFAALVLIDATTRQLPGVLGNESSAALDSFADGLLEPPSFSRARVWEGLEVPAVLLSGDHKKIKEWREALSILSTIQSREDLFKRKKLPLKVLQDSRKCFKSMQPTELKLCGLLDKARIEQILDDAISVLERK